METHAVLTLDRTCAGFIREGSRVPFADIDTFICSKQTDRFQDKADVENLERVKRLLRSD